MHMGVAVNWRLFAGVATIGAGILAGSAHATKTELVIGVAQFPPNMHPAAEPRRSKK